MLDNFKYKNHLFSVLTLIAFLLWLLSSFQARFSITNDMSELGLYSILSPLFFIAFGILISSYFLVLQLRDKSKSALALLFLQTLLLILFLNLTPAIVEGTARFTTSYLNYQSVSFVSETGHINPSMMWTQNWPDFTILVSEFAQITAIPSQSLLLVYPFVFNALLLLPLFVLFKALLNDSRMTWLAIWFVFLGNWIGQDYFSMQSIAFLIAILVIFLLFKNMKGELHTRQWVILFLLLFFYIASSHLLTAFAITCVVLVLYLSRHLKKPVFLSSLVVLISSWVIFNSVSYLQSNLGSLLNQALNIGLIFQRNLTNRLSGGAGHIFATDIRVVYSTAIVIFALVSIALTWKSRKIGAMEKKVLFVLIGFSLLIFAFAYGGELFMRLYMFALIPFAYFVSKVFLSNKRLLFSLVLFFVIAAPSLIIISHYGNEAIDYVPYSETVGTNFLYSSTATGSILGGTLHPGDFRDFTYRQNYTISSMRDVYLVNNSYLLWIRPQATGDRYICFSYGTYAFFSTYLGQPEFVTNLQGNVSQSNYYDLVYSNPSFSTYYSKSLGSSS